MFIVPHKKICRLCMYTSRAKWCVADSVSGHNISSCCIIDNKTHSKTFNSHSVRIHVFLLELLSTGFCVSTYHLALNVITCEYVLSINKCNLCRCYSSCRQGKLCVDMSFILKNPYVTRSSTPTTLKICLTKRSLSSLRKDFTHLHLFSEHISCVITNCGQLQ